VGRSGFQYRAAGAAESHPISPAHFAVPQRQHRSRPRYHDTRTRRVTSTQWRGIYSDTAVNLPGLVKHRNGAPQRPECRAEPSTSSFPTLRPSRGRRLCMLLRHRTRPTSSTCADGAHRASSSLPAREIPRRPHAACRRALASLTAPSSAISVAIASHIWPRALTSTAR
jgi:hypothetical protein